MTDLIVVPQMNEWRRPVPVLFTVDSAGNPIPPRAADPTDPNYQTRWDFFEVTYFPLIGADELFNFNLSNVQSANLPLSFRVGGADPSTKKPVEYFPRLARRELQPVSFLSRHES
jgi:hypothetical protein